MSPESCATDSPIMPFSIFGHWNRPSSRFREQGHARAVPEQTAPSNDSAPSMPRNGAASPSAPLRKSTGRVATSARIAPDGPITWPLQRELED
jgi:hypothetical protein